jgi:putative FmdB family regulatory protein
MPIYEFICKKCNNKFEHLLKPDEKVYVCPKCNGKDIAKIPSVIASSKSKSCKSNCANCKGCS